MSQEPPTSQDPSPSRAGRAVLAQCTLEVLWGLPAPPGAGVRLSVSSQALPENSLAKGE